MEISSLVLVFACFFWGVGLHLRHLEVPSQTGFECMFICDVALIRVLQRNRTNRIFMCLWRKRFKELAHVVMEAGKAKISHAGQQVQDPKELTVQKTSKDFTKRNKF